MFILRDGSEDARLRLPAAHEHELHLVVTDRSVCWACRLCLSCPPAPPPSVLLGSMSVACARDPLAVSLEPYSWALLTPCQWVSRSFWTNGSFSIPTDNPDHPLPFPSVQPEVRTLAFLSPSHNAFDPANQCN